MSETREPLTVDECPDCVSYAEAHWSGIRGACASVGIERGMSTTDVLAEFFGTFHAKGHQR